MPRVKRPALKLITAPAAEPITLTEAKAFLRVDHTSDDDLITLLITAARRKVEEYTRRALISQTWDQWHDAFPGRAIELGRPPLVSVTSVTTYDADDEATIMAAADYYVDTISNPGRVVRRLDVAWPTDLREANAIAVRFVAGYGATAADVPAEARQAIKATVGFLYEHRGDDDHPAAMQGAGAQALGTLNLPATARALVDGLRVLSL